MARILDHKNVYSCQINHLQLNEFIDIDDFCFFWWGLKCPKMLLSSGGWRGVQLIFMSNITSVKVEDVLWLGIKFLLFYYFENLRKELTLFCTFSFFGQLLLSSLFLINHGCLPCLLLFLVNSKQIFCLTYMDFIYQLSEVMRSASSHGENY